MKLSEMDSDVLMQHVSNGRTRTTCGEYSTKSAASVVDCIYRQLIVRVYTSTNCACTARRKSVFIDRFPTWKRTSHSGAKT